MDQEEYRPVWASPGRKGGSHGRERHPHAWRAAARAGVTNRPRAGKRRVASRGRRTAGSPVSHAPATVGVRPPASTTRCSAAPCCTAHRRFSRSRTPYARPPLLSSGPGRPATPIVTSTRTEVPAVPPPRCRVCTDGTIRPQNEPDPASDHPQLAPEYIRSKSRWIAAATLIWVSKHR